MNTERRLKILRVPQGCIISLLNKVNNFYLPRFKDLPEGAVILSVHYSHLCDCFDFTVYSDTFDIVEDCKKPPSIQTEFTYVRIPEETK